MRSSLLVPGACAVVAALMIGGCDDSEPDDQTESTTSTSGSPSASASKGPSMPAKATESDSNGAKAYVDHYIDIINYAADTGDTEQLRAAAKDCEYCQQFPAIYDDMYSNGGSFDGKPYELKGIEVEDGSSTVRAVATVETRRAATFQMAKDAKRQKPESQTLRWRFELRPTDDGWQIVGMDETS